MEEPLSDKLRIRFIELICQTNPKGLLPSLMVYNLPLDETLEIAQKYSITDAVALLEFKIGRVQHSLELFQKVASFLISRCLWNVLMNI